ncbi:hypothetical protein NM208_g591 [Fusarium decemcellulare]|uniref:Uncharacterized protein n=1 Tax=Fusarium decemcellulare TaxID=57161 RepID=A0ACC1SZ37_9HYPO|nr:hypothetical protein NM208_g591 [Fusarium decemcellulare]
MLSSEDLVVIIAAGGHQATYIIPNLYGKVRLRLVVNSEESAKVLAPKWPKAEIMRANLVVPSDCDRVLEGASTVYHIGPSIHPHEKEIGLYMVTAAKAQARKAGSVFKHFVLASVIDTQIRKMYNHDDKRYIEEALILSDLDYTILQPGDFFDMAFPAATWSQMANPVRHAVTAQQARSSFIVLKDLGEAAAKVILERERHYQAQYPLVSIGPITYGEATVQVGKAIGKEIAIQDYSVEEGAGMVLDSLFGDRSNVDPDTRDKMEIMIYFYRRRGILGNSNVLEWLLGRKPTSILEYVRQDLEQPKDGRFTAAFKA